jgi:pectate lyase
MTTRLTSNTRRWAAGLAAAARVSLARTAVIVLLAACVALPVNADGGVAFPGAQGWAARTAGGRGGQVVRVTSLAGSGPGSFAAAVQTSGPRIVVFEVGGVIDLGGQTLKITEPYLTIAGQTAPSPGVTLIRGGIDIATHDVIVQHIRVRPGEAGFGKMSGHDFDAISTIAGHDIIVDHCSLTWATDENLSASGPRFTGDTPEAWREGTSRRVTFSNNLIAEGLAFATHGKGEHSKGSLVHDNVTDILIVGNLYAHNYERNPLFKGGVRGMIVNNLVYDPGPRAMHYNLIAEEWGDHAPQVGRMVAIGNVLRAGPSTPADVAFMMLGGSGSVEWYAEDNLAVDRLGRPLPATARYTTAAAQLIPITRPALPEGVKVLPAEDVQDQVIRNAGARPWDRDAIDARIVANVIEGRGAIISSEREVGGYPAYPETRQPFDPTAWNLGDMTRR